MKVAVAGVTGFIGRRLDTILRARGDEVVPVDLHIWSQLAAETFDGVGAVVNLAGEPVAQRWTPEVKERLRESRVHATYRLIGSMTAAANPPRVLVNGSAIGYYGSRGDEVLTEDSAPGTDFLAELTRDWEQAAMRAESIGMRVAMIRTGIVLGHGGALNKMLPPFRAGVGGKLGSGRQWMSWIHLDDAVGLLLHALDHEDVTGPVNAVSPEPVRNEDFTEELARVLHRPAWFTVPKFALKTLYGEMAETIMGSQRVLPVRALHTGYEFRYDRLRPALERILTH